MTGDKQITQPQEDVQVIPQFRQSSLTTWRRLRDTPLALFQDIANACGDIGSCRIGPVRAIFVNSPELVHSLLVEHQRDFDKGFTQRYAFSAFVGNGLLTSEGHFHDTQRKVMAPVFQPRRLANYADTIIGYAERNSAQWNTEQEIDLDREMIRLTMSIISKVMLDDEIDNETDALGQAVNTGVVWIQHAMTHLTLPPAIPTPRNRKLQGAIHLLRGRLLTLIRERRQRNEDRGDLLSLLLQARYDDGQPMSDAQIYDETVTIFGAGHETTALALTWAFYLLMENPDCYDRLCAESDRVLKGRKPTYADVSRLPYALQVFKEAMRLYPPSSVILRHAVRNTELKGYPIRKGQIVMCSQHTLHHRAQTFPNPTRFDPDRFALEQEAALPRLAYMPFGAGGRICIGNHFALLEGQLILATLAQRVRFERMTTDDVKPALVVNLRPNQPIRVKVKERKQMTETLG